jgi:steroid delta-isomerase-like uncharacterized protein
LIGILPQRINKAALFREEKSMSTEENKAVVRRIVNEFLKEKNLEVTDELFADDFINHNPGKGTTPDSEGLKQFIDDLHTASPDINTNIEDLVAEGDKVVVRVTVRGTHKGNLWGIPPTEKQIEVSGISIFRFDGGKVVERWNLTDNLLLLQQIGIIPSTG